MKVKQAKELLESRPDDEEVWLVFVNQKETQDIPPPQPKEKA